MRLVWRGTWIGIAAGLAACAPAPINTPALECARGLRQVPLGLCEDYPEESRSLDEARRDLELARAAGVKVLRISIGWDGVEPERDRHDLAFWDAFVDLAVDEFGIRLIPYVAYTPRWNSAGAPEDFWKTPPSDLSQFEEILRELSARYRGRVHSWEIWNEPDNRDYWLGTAADYAALLEAGARGVRAGNPDAQVVFGGLAGGIEFARELFERHRASELVDVLNLHAYYETWNPNPLETLTSYLDEAASIVERAGGAEPLWLAEVGYSNFQSGRGALFEYEHTPEFQAVMLVRTHALVLAHEAVELVAWYELKDARASDAVIGDDHNRHLGIASADYRRKPAFDALAFTSALFGDGFRTLDAELTITRLPGSALELRAFATARHTAVVIAWRPTHVERERSEGSSLESQSESVKVALPYRTRSPAVAYDARGRVQTGAVRTASGASGTELTLDVRAGEVKVVELPLGPP